MSTGVLPLLLAAACSAPAARSPDLRTVVITNASGGPLSLVRVTRDGFDAPLALGSAATLRLAMAPGRYALQLGDSDHRVPLPLPPDGLGYAAPSPIEITVHPWPAPLAGYCWIPASRALRGDELGVGQEDERPLATPLTAGFWLATHETTNADYARFLAAIGRDRFDPAWLDLGGPQCHVRWDDAAGTYTTDAPDLPVVKCSHAGALAYCAWLTATTGVPHRLPTETEWEKAARGPGSRVFAYGDICTARAANQASGHLCAVGSFGPDGFGLYDMTGNAFEWTADTYRADAYALAVPQAEAAPREFYVLRGGSFVLDGVFLRNAMRMRLAPEVLADDCGFRVLREAIGESRP
ncbi:MAG: SUMF1/EgtB/PvdO family nonheme iron enzyme [Planctomycetes bacterium]|nr:SUMF1/EgtB/PvdO family nonheme iron enzyme [Planctomycetota bacterium]